MVTLTHMMFTYDLLLFSKADQSSIIRAFMAQLQKFLEASGLQDNSDKSEL